MILRIISRLNIDFSFLFNLCVHIGDQLIKLFLEKLDQTGNSKLEYFCTFLQFIFKGRE